MKCIFIISLVLCVIFSSTSFAIKKCVFIVKVDAAADQLIIDYLNANGYEVIVSVANGTVPVGVYDLAVISETNGSTDAVWKAFRNAPLPFVALKTFCARSHSNSLAWLTTSLTGTDYANTNDRSVASVAETHPILQGVTLNPTFVAEQPIDPNTNVAPFALQWVKFPSLPIGATVITTVTIGTGNDYTITEPIPQIIAFERGTSMNIATLTNRAVMAGFNFNANPYLTSEALKVIKQSCDWVIASNATAIQDVVPAALLKRVGGELLNPTNLDVEVYSLAGLRIICSKESAISLDGLTAGIYVAKTTAGVLKFVL